MFKDDERNELVGQLLLMLEQEKAGRSDGRQAFAERITDHVREYLGKRYSANQKPRGGPPGVVQSSDT